MAQSRAPQRFLQLIGGARVPSASGEWIGSVDPSTGQVWAEVPAGTADDVDAAVDAAYRAFHGGWRKTAAMQRAALLRRLADLVVTHAERLATAETRDNGRTFSETRSADIGFIHQMLHFFAGAADKIEGEVLEISSASFNYVRHQPAGVVALIIPWNAPLSILAAKLGAAIAAGCTLVVKPPESASCSILTFADLIAEAGFPDGVVNIVTGLGSVVGPALSSHPHVAKLSFTGSTATARDITRRSADAIKPLTFELGGKSANIIFPDADLKAAAVGATTAAVYTAGAGQMCLAGTRILVHRSIHDAFVESMIAIIKDIRLGDPMDKATQMGPMALEKQYDKVVSYLDIAKQEGVELAYGGRHGPVLFSSADPLGGGYWIEPTLYVGMKNDMRIAREEIFGPVAGVIPFDEEEEAIAIANDSEYGLAAGLWTNDLKRAHRVAADIEVGAIWINAYRRNHWVVPFGGMKDSGYGRDSGMQAVYSFLHSKGVWVDLGQ